MSPAELASMLGVPRVEVRDAVGSTLDVAHAIAADGAPAGTLVLANEQTAGRGRGGRAWSSPPGSGIWLTLVERPNDPAALAVLSLRLGIRAARVLDRFSEAPVRLKWPNDLYVGDRKLAGVLVETRWRDRRPEWAAVGFGLNVVAPADVPGASGLAAGTRRLDVLAELVPALRAAAAGRGALAPDELSRYHERDLARGRTCLSPAAGTVGGITAEGELVITAAGTNTTHRGGSLVLQGDHA